MKKKIIVILSCLLLISVLLGACTQQNTDLADTTWELYSTNLNGQEEKADETAQSNFKLIFESDGTMRATSGALTGINPKKYEVNGNKITLSDETQTIITATIKGNKMIVTDGEYTSTFQKTKNE